MTLARSASAWNIKCGPPGIATSDAMPLKFEMHSRQLTKVWLIYRRTANLRAVQLLVCYQIESIVSLLGVKRSCGLRVRFSLPQLGSGAFSDWSAMYILDCRHR